MDTDKKRPVTSVMTAVMSVTTVLLREPGSSSGNKAVQKCEHLHQKLQ